MSLRLSDIGEPLDWASTGMVFKHKHEDKIIKIMPRVPSEEPVRYIRRKIDDADWMITHGWTYLASDSITKFWRGFLKNYRGDVPTWLPKVSEADSARIEYHDMVDLIERQTDMQVLWDDDELLSIFTAHKVAKVPVNYIIMEYLPKKAEPLDSEQQLAWQREIYGWFWNNTATVVRDLLDNEENYLRRANGELVFFDPIVTKMPSPKAFKEMDTMNTMNFVEMVCGDNSDAYIDTYREYYDDLKPLKVSGQYCVPKGALNTESDYLSLGWYRSEEPSLEDYTLYDLANSNVVGNNWSTNVGRYA